MLWDGEMRFSSEHWIGFGEIWVKPPVARPACPILSRSRLLALEVDTLAEPLSKLWLRFQH